MPELSEAPSANVARIVVIREEQLLGGERGIVVYDGTRQIGTLGEGSYLAWDSVPGKRVLRLVFDRPEFDGGDLESIEAVSPPAGETTYFEVSLDLSAERKSLNRSVGAPVIATIQEEEGRSRLERLDSSLASDGRSSSIR
ncbi:MAG: hypothetical protein AAGG01_13325 [Planctomycetota bacterium]